MIRTRFDPEAVTDAVTQPPFSAVAARGDQLRSGRRTRVGALAVIVAALVGAAVAPSAARWNTESSTVAGTDRANPSGSVFTDTILAGDRTIVMVRRTECAVAFSVSVDAGASWSAYRGPVEWLECGIPIHVEYEIVSPTVFTATVHGVRYLSRDTASTWEPGEDRVAIVDAVPDRAVLRPHRALAAVDPATGAAYQLAAAGSVTTVTAARAAPDGALWVVGVGGRAEHRPSDAATQVTVSPDRGHTWAPAGTLPPVGDHALVVPVDARRAYVLGSKDGQGTIHRTDDGGRTWTSDAAPWTAVTAATVGRTGSLMAYGGQANGERVVWTSRDDGRTFAMTLAVEPGVTTAGHLGDAIWIAAPDGMVAVTRDGETWRRTPPRS